MNALEAVRIKLHRIEIQMDELSGDLEAEFIKRLDDMNWSRVMSLSGLKLPGLIKTIERTLIENALRTERSHADAAKLLGVNRTTFLEKMKRHGFQLGEPK